LKASSLSLYLSSPPHTAEPSRSICTQISTRLIHGLMTILNLFSMRLVISEYELSLQARTKVAEALTLVVRQRREEYNEGKEKKSDMLGALLASGDHFSDDQIVDFLLALLVAGYETTSTIMTLAVKFLTETPLALAQLKVRNKPKLPLCYTLFIYMIITIFVCLRKT